MKSTSKVVALGFVSFLAGAAVNQVLISRFGENVQVTEPVADSAPLLMRMVLLEDVGPFRAEVIRDGQPAIATPDGGVLLRKGTVIDVPLDTDVPVVPGDEDEDKSKIRKVGHGQAKTRGKKGESNDKAV